MTDREKVMVGLKCLTHVDEVVYKRECLARGCPYMDTDCDIAVMVDALKLIEGKEDGHETNSGDFGAGSFDAGSDRL